jgi:hypothetical protein
MTPESLTFQGQVEQKFHLTYYNEILHIGMVGIKHIYLLSHELTELYPEVYKAKVVKAPRFQPQDLL